MLKSTLDRLNQQISTVLQSIKNKLPIPFIKSHKRLSVMLLILFLFIFITIIVLFESKSYSPDNTILGSLKKGKVALSPTPTPTPRPSPRPIPSGKIGFNVSQGDRNIPQLRAGSIDPYDPANGANQTVTITVLHPQPITKVTGQLKTDNNTSSPIQFTLISGTNTDGQWQGSWKVTDTYLYVYDLVLRAESVDGKSASVTITLR